MKRLLRNLLIVALALVVVLCVIYRVVLSSSTPNEELALDAGISPADILLPTTNRVIDIKGNF